MTLISPPAVCQTLWSAQLKSHTSTISCQYDQLLDLGDTSYALPQFKQKSALVSRKINLSVARRFLAPQTGIRSGTRMNMKRSSILDRFISVPLLSLSHHVACMNPPTTRPCWQRFSVGNRSAPGSLAAFWEWMMKYVQDSRLRSPWFGRTFIELIPCWFLE